MFKCLLYVEAEGQAYLRPGRINKEEGLECELVSLVSQQILLMASYEPPLQAQS